VEVGVNKYRNKRTIVDNITFASKKEAARYGDLKLLEKHGLISDLQLQPKYVIEVNGVKICSYLGDFRYWINGEMIIEDVKGVKTPAYRLKKKLMLAVFGIEIQEV
jgi:hypothetical protein